MRVLGWEVQRAVLMCLAPPWAHLMGGAGQEGVTLGTELEPSRTAKH